MLESPQPCPGPTANEVMGLGGLFGRQDALDLFMLNAVNLMAWESPGANDFSAATPPEPLRPLHPVFPYPNPSQTAGHATIVAPIVDNPNHPTTVENPDARERCKAIRDGQTQLLHLVAKQHQAPHAMLLLIVVFRRNHAGICFEVSQIFTDITLKVSQTTVGCG